MIFFDYIRKNADSYPDRTAIVVHGTGEGLTYAEVYSRMVEFKPLPIPLLRKAWDGDFTLYTTGTTGTPNAVVISQERVVRDSLNLIASHGYCDGLQFIIAGPMDHLGCWSKLFPTLMVGGTLHILPNGMKDMDAFFRVMDGKLPTANSQQPTADLRYATFLVPANIRILLQLAADRLAAHADSIEFIETGAAPMAHSDMLQLCSILPHSRLFNTYASTEGGVIATYNYNDGICKEGCCGTPFANVGFRMADGGIIEGSNDIGFLDTDGMLHIVGRQDDMINVGGLKVSPVEIEDAAMTMPEIGDCICVARRHAIMGQVPELLVVMKDGKPLDRNAVLRFLATKLDRYKVPLTVREVDHIERTFNGKLNRKYYSN